MGIDWQAFKFHKATQNQAIELARKEAEAGRPLSPLTTKMLADTLTPTLTKGVEKKGGQSSCCLCSGLVPCPI